MHGFGDCASNFAETVGNFYNFNKLADAENFIIAYPQAAYRIDKDDHSWEPGDNGVNNIYDNDAYFIQDLIADLLLDYNINENKIYACGYSNGGMMAYSLACNKSDLLSGIGIMSGTMLEEDCYPDKPIPIISFHGIADGVLPYSGSTWYQSVSQVVDFWLEKNNIPNTSLMTTELNEGKVVRDEYADNMNKACLTLYTIYEEYDKPGDHVWFSEEINGEEPNKLMWDFFNGNCKSTSSQNENLNQNNLFKVNPNPFTNHLTIESTNINNQIFSLRNVHGMEVFSGKIKRSPYTLDLSNLTPDIYFLNYAGTVKKLIKTK